MGVGLALPCLTVDLIRRSLGTYHSFGVQVPTRPILPSLADRVCGRFQTAAPINYLGPRIWELRTALRAHGCTAGGRMREEMQIFFSRPGRTLRRPMSEKDRPCARIRSRCR